MVRLEHYLMESNFAIMGLNAEGSALHEETKPTWGEIKLAW